MFCNSAETVCCKYNILVIRLSVLLILYEVVPIDFVVKVTSSVLVSSIFCFYLFVKNTATHMDKPNVFHRKFFQSMQRLSHFSHCGYVNMDTSDQLKA